MLTWGSPACKVGSWFVHLVPQILNGQSQPNKTAKQHRVLPSKWGCREHRDTNSPTEQPTHSLWFRGSHPGLEVVHITHTFLYRNLDVIIKSQCFFQPVEGSVLSSITCSLEASDILKSGQLIQRHTLSWSSISCFVYFTTAEILKLQFPNWNTMGLD